VTSAKDFQRAVAESKRLQGEGELSTGTGALMMLGLIAYLLLEADRAMKKRGA
jgi:hypothetical protein